MNDVIYIVLIVVLAILAFFVIPPLRVKRAVRQVIFIFRQHSATNIKSAKTLDELGLRPKGMLDSMFKGRDYKPHALQTLMKAEIIQHTEDGRFYLSEEKLSLSGFEKR